MALQQWLRQFGLTLGLAFFACSCGSEVQQQSEKSEPPVFNPTVAVQCRMSPESDGQDFATFLQAVIEETVREKKRVTVVDDSAAARLLLAVDFSLKQGSSNVHFCHRFRIVDAQHDVVVFEDVFLYPGAPYTDSEATVMVRSEFERLAEYLEKSISVSSQIELGGNGVAYLEGSLRRGSQANYFRFDRDPTPRRLFVDYPLDLVGSGFSGIATTMSVNKLYEIAEEQNLELVATAEQADVRIKVVGSTGSSKSYTRVRDGKAARFATESSVAMQATIRVFVEQETEPRLEIDVSAAGPSAKRLKKSPQEISIQNFKSALGKEIGKVSALLETI